MRRFGRMACLFSLILLVPAVRPLRAGEACLLDREAVIAAVDSPAHAASAGQEEGERLFFLLDGGRVCPVRWSAPVLESLAPFGTGIIRIAAVPGEAGCWLLAFGEDGRAFQLWRRDGQDWTAFAEGDAGERVTAVAGGHYAAGEAAGLFVQYESGRIGYWRVRAEGCTPIWQSPNPQPPLAAARSVDLDGDGQDEVLAIEGDGAVAVMRWRNGLWEACWQLPSWGQVLGLDAGESDGQPGAEIALVTSHRQILLLGASGGSLAVKARLATAMVASFVGLLPGGNGAIMLGDAAGSLHLLLRDGNAWRFEARLGGEERFTFVAGLGPERVLAGTAGGNLQVVRATALRDLSVFYDGGEAGNKGIFWNDGEFYFSPEFLRAVLGIASKWEEKKGRLTLTAGKLTVTAQVDKKEIGIKGRPWTLNRAVVLAGKVPFVPAELLATVFLISVTYDPSAGWLILTSASGEVP
ncbi:MAG: stalk domain-containing protein [Patescibacteria group bacterium]